jgi:hypothetical protein
MLNRIHRTQTTNLNRLNLGLANVAGTVNVAKIQRTALAHARKFPAPIGIMDPSDPSIMGSRWYRVIPSSPCCSGSWPESRQVEVVAVPPVVPREVVPVDVFAQVTQGRPGGPALADQRRQPAAKRRGAAAPGARASLAGTSTRPAASFAAGG